MAARDTEDEQLRNGVGNLIGENANLPVCQSANLRVHRATDLDAVMKRAMRYCQLSSIARPGGNVGVEPHAVLLSSD